MKKLSVGIDSTLKNWRDLTAITFGKNSKATEYLENKIAKEGENSEVLADERQLLQLLGDIHFGRTNPTT